jgi:hypothetical protein
MRIAVRFDASMGLTPISPLKNTDWSRFDVATPLVGDAQRSPRRPQGARFLRLMQIRLDATGGEGSCRQKPEWNPRKRHPSILDLRRLFWRYFARFSKLLLKLEKIAKVPPASIPATNPRGIAA